MTADAVSRPPLTSTDRTLLLSFGIIAAVLQIIAVAMPLFHRDVVFPMLAPLGVCQLVVAIWLIAKGFQDQPRSASS